MQRRVCVCFQGSKTKAPAHPFFQSRSQKREAPSVASIFTKKSRTDIIQVDDSSSSSPSPPSQCEVFIKPDPDGNGKLKLGQKIYIYIRCGHHRPGYVCINDVI